ncbi:hypothetical protein MP638_003189 [Amoeboaphelidium occidentale]|nr:hypothetical protein MP638_003189 [Amoeboaphelidium occidentale]
MSLSSLPPELIRIIAENLSFEEINWFDLERIGLETGDIFYGLDYEIHSSGQEVSVYELYERMEELREKNPALAKTPYWHTFEDFLFTKYRIYMDKDDVDFTDKSGAEMWLNIFNFAFNEEYALFKKEIVEHTTYRIIISVSEGSIDCDEALEYLGDLMPLMQMTCEFAYNRLLREEKFEENLSKLSKGCEMVMKAFRADNEKKSKSSSSH